MASLFCSCRALRIQRSDQVVDESCDASHEVVAQTGVDSSIGFEDDLDDEFDEEMDLEQLSKALFEAASATSTASESRKSNTKYSPARRNPEVVEDTKQSVTLGFMNRNTLLYKAPFFFLLHPISFSVTFRWGKNPSKFN